MKKTHNALIWTVALTVTLLLSVKTAWADGLSMADIAMEEPESVKYKTAKKENCGLLQRISKNSAQELKSPDG